MSRGEIKKKSKDRRLRFSDSIDSNCFHCGADFPEPTELQSTRSSILSFRIYALSIYAQNLYAQDSYAQDPRS